MKRFDLQSSYILHSRPYQETSLLLEVFTREHGRFGVIAKGVRRPKNPARSLLQPFVPLLLSCAGRGELLSLKSYEPEKPQHFLSGRRLISGFYINELLVRLLHRFDPHEIVFDNYYHTLLALENTSGTDEQITLRLFEKTLLKDLGYELPLTQEAETGKAIQPECTYSFNPEHGPSLAQGFTQDIRIKNHYLGKSLLALAENDLQEASVLKDAKRLMRQALAVLLGDKPLETRRLL